MKNLKTKSWLLIFFVIGILLDKQRVGGIVFQKTSFLVPIEFGIMLLLWCFKFGLLNPVFIVLQKNANVVS